MPVQWQMSPAMMYEHYVQTVTGLIKLMIAVIFDMYNRNKVNNVIVDLSHFDEEVTF